MVFFSTPSPVIDLIYEGIETVIPPLVSHAIANPVIDLIYEGIETFAADTGV